MGTETADQGVAQKIEISDRVKNLMLDELVTVAKAVIVNHPEVIHDDGIIQTAAAGESSFLQRLGPGARTVWSGRRQWEQGEMPLEEGITLLEINGDVL